jgi:hypothetical protein
MIRLALLSLFILPTLLADDFTLVFDGKEGPGKGKHIVLVSGDEEYRTEESMPMLAKILSQRHGFKCTVVFAWSADGKFIDPNNQAGLRGLAALDSADLMLIGTRFRKPSQEEAAHVTAFLNAKKPVIGIRTATHAFNGGGKFGNIGYGQFGRLVLGEQWVSHHGKHKKQGARGVIEEANASHAILNSVTDVFAPSDVYGVKHLTDADTVLLRGAVTETLDPASKAIDGGKNDPMQALAWLHTYKTPDGSATGTSFCTTAGASVDLVSEDLRRLVVNAAYHLTGLDVPDKANVDYIDSFKPSFYGFCKAKDHWKERNLTLADFALGVGVKQVDPKGSPAWDFR